MAPAARATSPLASELTTAITRPASLNTRSAGSATTSAIAPDNSVSAATRSPALTCASAGALRTTPAPDFGAGHIGATAACAGRARGQPDSAGMTVSATRSIS